jgi:hypothetical protein
VELIPLLEAHILLSEEVAVEATEAGHKMVTMVDLVEEVQTSRVQLILDLVVPEQQDKGLMEEIHDVAEVEKYLVVVAVAPEALVPMVLHQVVVDVQRDPTLQEMAGMEYKIQ